MFPQRDLHFMPTRSQCTTCTKDNRLFILITLKNDHIAESLPSWVAINTLLRQPVLPTGDLHGKLDDLFMIFHKVFWHLFYQSAFILVQEVRISRDIEGYL